jgi:ribonucleotide reductase alpha subunit
VKETGGPDLLCKDSINRKTNQKNLGVCRNSNLCSEITEYSDEDEYAVCNLASISLAAFVKVDGERKVFDYEELLRVCMIVHRNLDRIIDLNYYPDPRCRYSNLHHRPVGLGTQGWADLLLELDLPFETTVDPATGVTKICEETRLLNRRIAETMYYACLRSSIDVAMAREPGMARLAQALAAGELEFEEDGLTPKRFPAELAELVEQLRPIRAELEDRTSHYGSYATFLGSPASQGQFQPDLWGIRREELLTRDTLDWKKLYADGVAHGLRNSLSRANMPTATTAQVLGNSECNEPYKYCIYTRRVNAGEYVVVNKYLHRDLRKAGLWTNEVKRQIVADRGSIQQIATIPQAIKDKYRTAFEISKRTIQLLAAERGPFVCQSESLNYFVRDPNDRIMTNILMGAWKLGLKTAMYYLRREPTVHPVQFTVDKGFSVSGKKEAPTAEGCVSCTV